MSTQSFKAGASKVNITPPLGTYINGDFIAHYAQYIHDKLYSKALVFQQDDTFIAIVVVDICVMPKDFLDGIKSEITRAAGIKPENILISSTHTHAAGSVASVYLGAADLQYMKKLPPLIVESVVDAKRKLKPAKLAWGNVDVPEHVLCRRYKMKSGYSPQNPVTGNPDLIKTNPFGGEGFIDYGINKTDPEVSFVAVKGVDNNWISLLANYSLHYVGDWENGTISSDYFGEFSRQLKSRLNAGDDFVGIMSNGTSGDINIWDFGNHKGYPAGQFEKSKLIGGDIAEKVFQLVDELEWDSNPALAAKYTEVILQLRKPSAAELSEAKKVVIESKYEGMQIDGETLKRLYAREQVLLNDLPNTLEFPVQAFKIGKGAIGGLGAEIFAETGLKLKEKALLKNYFTISLANGNAGYVPPQHEFENGGYETWRSRTSKLETKAEEIVKNSLLKLIDNVTSE